jgi:hypothetical protein
MKGLIIKSPWIDKILAGEKTWEIRGSNTKIRGKISLIKSGSGMILGKADLVDCVPRVSLGAIDYRNKQNYSPALSSVIGGIVYKQIIL